jgi:GNAT superfamily N-acetyltransferase
VQAYGAHHAHQAAEIHVEGEPGTLLTNLGKPFLTTLYAEVCHSEWGFGVVALDGEVVTGVGIKKKDAEFLFLGVRNAYRGQRIASVLFDKSVILCRERKVDHLIATVEHTNWRLHQAGSTHVARYGWRRIRQMELNGRVMDVIEMDLTHELPPEEWGPSTVDPDVLSEG